MVLQQKVSVVFGQPVPTTVEASRQCLFEDRLVHARLFTRFTILAKRCLTPVFMKDIAGVPKQDGNLVKTWF
jgi:hypothetical protein